MIKYLLKKAAALQLFFINLLYVSEYDSVFSGLFFKPEVLPHS